LWNPRNSKSRRDTRSCRWTIDRAAHTWYSQEAFEHRKLILLHCNNKKNCKSGAPETADVVEAVDKNEQKAYIWYILGTSSRATTEM
jgi:hypothetical protein